MYLSPMRNYVTPCLILACLLACSASVPEFVPTEEWQEIKEGQSIPMGLDIRMNLNTGGKWARLMPKQNDAKADAAKQAVLVSAPDGTVEGPQLSEDNMAEDNSANTQEDSSEDIPEESPEESPEEEGEEGEEGPDRNEEQEEDERQDDNGTADRNAEALRYFGKRFQHLSQASDVKIMAALVQTALSNNSSSEDIVQALESLEDLLHSVDNAIDFIGLQGVQMALRNLASPPIRNVSQDLEQATKINIQSRAAWLLGTASQNNRKVQAEILTEHGIRTLLQVFGSTLGTLKNLAESNIAKDHRDELDEELHFLLGKLIYAIGAACRGNGDAQVSLSENKALTLINDGFDLLATRDTSRRIVKVQMKTLRLLYDMAVDAIVNKVQDSNNSTEAPMQILGDIGSARTCNQIAKCVSTEDDGLAEAAVRLLGTLRTAGTQVSSDPQKKIEEGCCCHEATATPDTQSALARWVKEWGGNAEPDVDDEYESVLKIAQQLQTKQ